MNTPLVFVVLVIKWRIMAYNLMKIVTFWYMIFRGDHLFWPCTRVDRYSFGLWSGGDQEKIRLGREQESLHYTGQNLSPKGLKTPFCMFIYIKRFYPIMSSEGIGGARSIFRVAGGDLRSPCHKLWMLPLSRYLFTCTCVIQPHDTCTLSHYTGFNHYCNQPHCTCT